MGRPQAIKPLSTIKLRVLVCGTNAVQCERTGSDIARIARSNVDIVASVWNHYQVMECLRTKDIDVIFIDPSSDHYDHFEIAAHVNGLTQRPLMVFVCASADSGYVTAAFDVGAVDYLLLPLQPSRLGEAVYKLQNRISCRKIREEREASRVVITRHSPRVRAALQVRTVPISSLVYIQEQGPRLLVRTTNEELICEGELADISRKIPEPHVVSLGTLVLSRCISFVLNNAAQATRRVGKRCDAAMFIAQLGVWLPVGKSQVAVVHAASTRHRSIPIGTDGDGYPVAGAEVEVLRRNPDGSLSADTPRGTFRVAKTLSFRTAARLFELCVLSNQIAARIGVLKDISFGRLADSEAASPRRVGSAAYQRSGEIFGVSKNGKTALMAALRAQRLVDGDAKLCVRQRVTRAAPHASGLPVDPDDVLHLAHKEGSKGVVVLRTLAGEFEFDGSLKTALSILGEFCGANAFVEIRRGAAVRQKVITAYRAKGQESAAVLVGLTCEWLHVARRCQRTVLNTIQGNRENNHAGEYRIGCERNNSARGAVGRTCDLPRLREVTQAA